MLIITLFFISYFIIKIILKSRNVYYSIIRMLGGTKKITTEILLIELLLVANLAYLSFVCLEFFNLNGFINTDREVIKMARTFKASKLQILTKIVIPANIGTFINSLKVNIGLSLVGVISGEFLVSKAGLGYLIVYGIKSRTTDT